MRSALRASLILALGLAACGDPSGPRGPARLVEVVPLLQSAAEGEAVPQAPAVRVTNPLGKPFPGVTVTFTVTAGGGALVQSQPVSDANGIASTGGWTLGTQPGPQTVTAAIAAAPGTTIVFEAVALPPGCTALLILDQPLGGFERAPAGSLPCLLFDPAHSAGHEYVLLVENMPANGAYDAAVFPGPAAPATTTIELTLRGAPPGAAPAPAPSLHLIAQQEAAAHEWDFGAGRLREYHPEPPPLHAIRPQLLREDGAIPLNSIVADPAVGDTIQIWLEGIPRLGIATGNQRAVIRHVSDHLIIAEDVRLTTTLPRQDGGFNTPLAPEDMTALAAEYSAVARVQGDLFFEGRHNTSVEALVPMRVTAVHTLMPAEEFWGYTYPQSGYFVWDYWVGTDGSTKGLNQHPQRVTDNLFMHEIAHMRHMGMLQRAGMPPRGNRWLVEGFARFTERLPIAARLLGTTAPSRTGNIVLPYNTAFGNAYFVDDVPTYASASGSMFFGYQNSSFVFDYFADQVAQRGGNWLVAVRELLLAAGAQATLDAAVARWLPGHTFSELFTRARIALYTDDIGTAGLPAWTQYHQYQLRASRPAPSQLAQQDPRVLWPRIPAGSLEATRSIGPGSAFGFVIDGSLDPQRTLFRLSAPAVSDAVVSVARVR